MKKKYLQPVTCNVTFISHPMMVGESPALEVINFGDTPADPAEGGD